MSTQTNWQRLRALAQEKRDACTQVLSEALAAARREEQKLQMLRTYQTEYGQRMSADSHGGIAATRLQNFRGFLAHLERAVEQQEQAVHVAQQAVYRFQVALVAARRTVDSYQVLVDRQLAAAGVVQRRDQQKQQDEYASRALPRFLTGAD
ncbi:MAG: flagellar export protein FliJ [Casimicrobiaceae bacterium]